VLASQTISSLANSPAYQPQTDISGAQTVLTTNQGSSTDYSGTIGGTGTLRKVGSTTLTLSGSASNALKLQVAGGVVELNKFGPVNAVQTITGRWFASVQGGTFMPGVSEDLVRRMSGWGAAGVGQSSWGPTVYGIVDGERAGADLADRVRHAIGSTGAVYEGPFRADGACVRQV
jgi:predicted sugar kinase